MSDDSELLRRFAANDTNSESAFAEFVQRRVGFVYGTAMRQTAGNAHLAGDIAQAVFLAVSKKASSLANHERLSGWLHTTTTLIARRMLRDARLRHAREQEAAAMNKLLSNDTKSTGHEQMREVLDDALGRLGENDREIVLMRFFENRDFAEIGTRMNLSEDTARKRVARAMEKLRTLFARRGVSSTAAALGALMTAEAAAAAPAGLANSVSGAIVAGSGATALSTAAATAATSGGILAFMSTTKISVITAIVALAAAGVAFRQTQHERAAVTTLASAQRENENLRKQVGEAERLARIHAAAEAARTTPANTTATPLPANDPIAAGEAFMAAHPEVRQTMLAYHQAVYAGMDYLACMDLGLDAAQRAELAKIRASRATAMPMATPDGRGKMALATSFLEDVQIGQKMTDLLGEDGGKKFGIASRTHSTAFPLTMPLAQSLYYTDTPLTATQSRQLEDICVKIHEQQRSLFGTASDWDTIIEQAQSILSQPQLDVLAGLKKRDEYRQAQQQAQATAKGSKK